MENNNEILINTVIDYDWAKNKKKLDDLEKKLQDLQREKQVNIKVRDDASKALEAINKQIDAEKKKLAEMNGQLTNGKGIDAQKQKIADLTKQAELYQNQIQQATVNDLKIDYKTSYYSEMLRGTAAELVNTTKVTEDQINQSIERIQTKLAKLVEKREENRAYREALTGEIASTKEALAREEQILAQMKPSLRPDDVAAMDAQKAKVQELATTLATLERQYRSTATADTKLSAEIAATQDQLIALGDAAKEYASKEQEATSSTERNADAVKKANDEMEKSTGAAQKQGDAMERTANAAERSATAITKFGNRIAGLVKRVFVFSLITRGLREVRSWFTKVLKTNDEARAAMGNLKAAVLTFIQPLVQAVIPALTKIMNILSALFYYASKALSAIFGISFQSMLSGAQSLYDTTSGTAQSLSDANKNAKELKRTLASFDTLEILQKDDEDTKLDTLANPDVGGSVSPNWDFNKVISDEIKKIAFLTSLGMIAVGLILIFSGAGIGVGLALLVMGALSLYGEIKEDWDAISKMLQGPIGKALAIIAIAFVVIGLLCLIAGQPGIGLGCIAAGALLLAPVVAANKEAIKEMLEGPLGTVLDVLAIGLIVIGFICLLVPGKSLAGVVLLLTGLGLYLGKKIVEGDINLSGENAAQQILSAMAPILRLVEIGCLCLGFICLFLPGRALTGVLLILAGLTAAAGIAVAEGDVNLSGDNIAQQILAAIAPVLKILSYGMIALGFVCLFLPGRTLTGVLLILAGLVAYAGVAIGEGDVDLKGDDIAGQILNAMKPILELVGTAAWVVGLICIMMGDLVHGIPLFLAGIAMAIGFSTWDADMEKETAIWQQAAGELEQAEDDFLSGLDATVNEAGEIVRNGAGGAVEGVGLTLDEIKSLCAVVFGEETMNQMGDDWQAMLGYLGSEVAQNKDEIMQNFMVMADEAKANGENAVAYIAEHMYGLQLTAEEKAAIIAQSASDASTAIQEKAEEGTTAVEEQISETADNIQQKTASVVDDTGERYKTMSAGAVRDTQSIEEENQNFVDKITEGLGKISEQATALGDEAETQADRTKKNIDGVGTKVSDETDSMIDDLVDAFTKMTDEAEKAGKNTPKKMSEGMDSTSDEIDKTAQWLSQIAEGEFNTIPIKSREIGAQSSEALSSGMESKQFDVQDTADKIKKIFPDAFDGLPDEMEDTGSSSGENLDSGFGGYKSAVADTVDSMYDVFQLALHTLLPGKMWEWGDEAGGHYQDGLESSLTDLEQISYRMEEMFSPQSSLTFTIRNFFYSLRTNFVSALNDIIYYIESASYSINSGLAQITSNLNRVAMQASSINSGSYYTNTSPFYGSYLSRLSYPAYAQGTVIPPNSLHLAFLGDNKKEPEVVSPVSTMKQAFKEALQEMGGMNGNVDVFLDGKQIYDVVSKWHNRAQRALGN